MDMDGIGMVTSMLGDLGVMGIPRFAQVVLQEQLVPFHSLCKAR